MFFIPRVNVIESDAGFSVEVLGRTELRYVEGDRVLIIDSEMLAGPSGLAVYSDSIEHWSAPSASESIDATTKARIIENIKAAFKFRGLDIQVF
jgi:hypothetical protein